MVRRDVPKNFSFRLNSCTTSSAWPPLEARTCFLKNHTQSAPPACASTCSNLQNSSPGRPSPRSLARQNLWTATPLVHILERKAFYLLSTFLSRFSNIELCVYNVLCFVTLLILTFLLCCFFE